MSNVTVNTKYLSDGRKVAVVGKLNQSEYIVQEVFVTPDGDEIPAGDRFVSSSLHDSAVKSYKQKEEERAANNLESIQKSIKTAEIELSKVKQRLQQANDMMKSANRLIGNLDYFDWGLFCDIATGNFKYIVECDYMWHTPQEVDKSDYHLDKHSGRYEGLRMISLVFNGEFDHSYNIFQYKDGSGRPRKIDVIRTDEELSSWLTKKADEHYSRGTLTLDHLVSIGRYVDTSKYRSELEKRAVDEINSAHEKRVNDANKFKQERLRVLGLI